MIGPIPEGGQKSPSSIPQNVGGNVDDEGNNGPVRFSYNPYFSAYFFRRNSIFLSQQISQNNVSTCFFSEANGANLGVV